jgi:hypothetical protein
MTESSFVRFAEGDYKGLLYEPEPHSDGGGHHVLVELVAGPSMEKRLTYDVDLDQTGLPEAIGSLARLTTGRI